MWTTGFLCINIVSTWRSWLERRHLAPKLSMKRLEAERRKNISLVFTIKKNDSVNIRSRRIMYRSYVKWNFGWFFMPSLLPMLFQTRIASNNIFLCWNIYIYTESIYFSWSTTVVRLWNQSETFIWRFDIRWANSRIIPITRSSCHKLQPLKSYHTTEDQQHRNNHRLPHNFSVQTYSIVQLPTIWSITCYNWYLYHLCLRGPQFPCWVFRPVVFLSRF